MRASISIDPPPKRNGRAVIREAAAANLPYTRCNLFVNLRGMQMTETAPRLCFYTVKNKDVSACGLCITPSVAIAALNDSYPPTDESRAYDQHRA